MRLSSDRCVLLVFWLVVSSASAAERPTDLPEDAKPWSELVVSSDEAHRSADAVYFVLSTPTPESLTFPRLQNRMRSAHWLGDESKQPLALRPDPETWTIRLANPPNEPAIVVLNVDGGPQLITEPTVMTTNDDRELVLPAHQAVTHGEKLRYEPQPHKNTVGYWTVPSDWAEWSIEIPNPGVYEVELLQGCGRGQGGSEVDIIFSPETSDEKQVLPYTVTETGHFQNFRRVSAGLIDIRGSGRYQLQLKPTKLANKAVMDVREIRIRPGVQRGEVALRQQPHVLILFTDDQGTLDAGCYGSRDLFTPFMDGLANDGVRFTQAYAHTVCCPARALLMTGRHPQRSSVNDWMQGEIDNEQTDRAGRNMSLDEVTLAEHLGSHAYRTALFGKWHLGGGRDFGPTKQGFGEFFGIRNGFIDNYNHYFLHREGYHDLYRGTEEVWHPGEYFPDLVVNEAERFLDQHARQRSNRPFFLYIGFNIPHYPEQADDKFDQHYVNTKEPRGSYGRIVSTTDDRMGRILAKLDEHRWRDDTIVIWMSDNGHSAEDYAIKVDNHMSGYAQDHNYGANGGGGNTGKWIGNKSTFYEGGLRVPAVISYPRKLPKGIVRDQTITAADWYPTLCDLCGIDPPSGVTLDGASLLPVINDDAPTHHDVLHWQWQDKWAVREGDWKLIHLKKDTLLVNLTDEKPETINHADAHPEIVQRLTAEHDRWINDVTP